MAMVNGLVLKKIQLLQTRSFCMNVNIKVIVVPEWMTSQTCPFCHSRFPKTIKQASDEEEYTPFWKNYVRGLLCCQSESCKSCRYYDRDLVGASNILLVGSTKEEDLPNILRREFKDSRPKRGSHHKLLV